MAQELKPYNKYKQANFSWLIQVPSHWETKRVSTLFDEQKTKNSNFEFKNAFQFKFGEIVEKKQIGTVDELRETYEKYTLVDENDIVINGLNLNYDFVTQRVGLVKKSGIITSAYISISTREYINPKYACYLFKSMDNMKMLNGMGTGIRLTLAFGELKKQYLPFPPRPEQDQIVKFLDFKISKINKFIKDKKREIELLREHIEYLCYNEAGSEKTITNWDSAFDHNWKRIKAKRLFEEIKIKNSANEELLAVTQDRGVVYKKDCTQNYVSPVGSLDGLKLVRSGDFVISLRSFQGGIEYSFLSGIVSPAYNVFCLNQKFNNDALKMYYRFLFKTKPFIELLKSLGGGIRDGKNISFSDFSQFYMPIPSTEQLVLIGKVSKKLDVLQKQKTQLFNLMNEYKASLISQAVTGKIDVRDVKIDEIVELDTLDDLEAEVDVEEVAEE